MKSELRFVLDTNVLVSAVLRLESIPGRCLECIMHRHTLVVSEPLLNEYSEVLMRSKFDDFVDREIRIEVLERIALEATPILIEHSMQVCRDANDDKLFEAALNGKASAIVGGDQDVLEAVAEGVIVVSPSEFLAQYCH